VSSLESEPLARRCIYCRAGCDRDPAPYRPPRHHSGGVGV